jgi:hypothetical protein
MSRKPTLLIASLLVALALAYGAGAVSGQSVYPQSMESDRQNTKRTIPTEFGRVVGTVTDDRFEHALVMEATDGTIRVVPFRTEWTISVFPRR